MGTLTEVGEITLGVGSDLTVLEFGNQLTFITLSCVTEGFEGISFADLGAHDGLFAFLNLRDLRFDCLKIRILDDYSLGGHHIIIKTVFNCRADTELDTRIEFLERLCHQVRGRMPKGMFRLLVFPLESLHATVLILYFYHSCNNLIAKNRAKIHKKNDICK